MVQESFTTVLRALSPGARARLRQLVGKIPEEINMPAWLLSALRLLGGGAAFGGGLELAERLPFLGGGGDGDGLDGARPLRIDPVTGRVVGVRRRRRRRALTASDRADIAFVAGMISKAAAKDFAVQLAARPR